MSLPKKINRATIARHRYALLGLVAVLTALCFMTAPSSVSPVATVSASFGEPANVNCNIAFVAVRAHAEGIHWIHDLDGNDVVWQYGQANANTVYQIAQGTDPAYIDIGLAWDEEVSATIEDFQVSLTITDKTNSTVLSYLPGDSHITTYGFQNILGNCVGTFSCELGSLQLNTIGQYHIFVNMYYYTYP